MTEVWDRRVRIGCAALACFCAGMLADAALRIRYAPPNALRLTPDAATSVRPKPEAPRVSASPAPPVVTPAPSPTATTGEMSWSGLRVPLDGVSIDSFKGGFAEHRGHGPHEAVDMLAPRGTPVHAVTTGTIAKLFYSQAGGNTIYQFDADGRLCYYYAHLDRYVEGLRDGQTVQQGDLIGYVGTTGNAPPGTPHLHFAVFATDGDKRWWKGRALDPYDVFKEKG